MHVFSALEDSWIAGCRRGESRFQEQVYRHFAPKMMAVCLRFMRHREEAEDVLASGFVRIFEGIRDFRRDGSFEGWIRRIIVNEALMALRKRRASFEEIALLDHHVHNDSGTWQWQPARLEEAELMQCIRELPDGYRAVFNLYAIEGYSHQEIADALGIDVNTSKSQLSRARKALKDRISESNASGISNHSNHGK